METEIGIDIEKAAYYLSKEMCVAIPTETVYGLAANALQPMAVKKIFQIKERPLFNPLIMHISNPEEANKYVEEIPSWAKSLWKKWPSGPLTLLLPKSSMVPDIITAGLPRVALRVPSHPLTNALLRKIDFPLAAPSANPFKYISPTTAEHVYKQLKGLIPYILDGGPCQSGIESSIIGEEKGKLILYRSGSLTLEQLEAAVGPIYTSLTREEMGPVAPGMLRQHYSPKTRFIYGGDLEELLAIYPIDKIGCIRLQSFSPIIPEKQQVLLSPSGDLEVAAHNLYAVMHSMDTGKYDIIHAEQVPNMNVGAAIHDRLSRAASE